MPAAVVQVPAGTRYITVTHVENEPCNPGDGNLHYRLSCSFREGSSARRLPPRKPGDFIEYLKLPRHVGFASGVTLGLSIGLGSVCSPLLGVLADHTSLRTALFDVLQTPH